MNKKLINKAQTEIEGLLTHGTSEIDIINQFDGDCKSAAKWLAEYALEVTGEEIDADNLADYFEYVKAQ